MIRTGRILSLGCLLLLSPLTALAGGNTLLIPATAVLQSGLATRVFVEQAPFQYESRIVTLGHAAGDKVEVLSGLKAGERIVVQGGVLLND